MSPETAVLWAVTEVLAEPKVPRHSLESGYFVYSSTLTEDSVTVVAYDARNEVPHHFRLSIEKVDD